MHGSLAYGVKAKDLELEVCRRLVHYLHCGGASSPGVLLVSLTQRSNLEIQLYVTFLWNKQYRCT